MKKHDRRDSREFNVKCLNSEQAQALEMLKKNQFNFILGPAGTGKTFLAMSYALHHFNIGTYNKIIMTRPAIEAGEKLGFLPGELEDKMDPYMTPFYDQMKELSNDKYLDLRFREERFEVAPLAYMRGRNFNDCVVIVDEAQNATKDQLLMILTRLGKTSKMIISGDPKQKDIKKSYLQTVAEKLSIINGIDHCFLNKSVRNPLIDQIVQVMDKID